MVSVRKPQGDGTLNPEAALGGMTLNQAYKLPSDAVAYIESKTSESNADILGGIRQIVETEVKRIAAHNVRAELTPKQADVLLKLTKIYESVEAATNREHAKYEVSGKSEEELKALSAGRRV